MGTLTSRQKQKLLCMYYLFWNGVLCPTVRKNCSRDQEKLLKFEAETAEDREFAESELYLFIYMWMAPLIRAIIMLAT